MDKKEKLYISHLSTEYVFEVMLENLVGNWILFPNIKKHQEYKIMFLHFQTNRTV